MNNAEGDSIIKLINGEIDALVTTDAYEDEQDHGTIPVVKIGQSNFFFAISKNRPDLLGELNFAMSKINEENRFYNDYLDNKYLKSSGTNAFLPNEELNWLAQHDTIRVGYLSDFAPFCESSATGGLNGVLKNYLELAKNCTKNATLNFDTKSYSTLQDALQALKDNDVDCVFPVHLSFSDAESYGIMTTNPFMQTEMYLMTSKSSQKVISADEKIVVAMNKTNASHKTFLMDNYPNWQILECNNLDEALSAVESSRADCALVNNYQAAQVSAEEYDFYALATGKEMDFSFAVRKSDSALYYILNKTATLVPSASLQSALTEYSSSGRTVSLGEFLRRYFYVVILLFAAAAFAVIRFNKRRAELREQVLKEKLAVQEKEIQNEHRAREINSVGSSIAADYRSIFSVDLEHDAGTCYRARNGSGNVESDLEDVNMGDNFSFSEKFLEYANKFVAEADREKFLNFIKPEIFAQNYRKKSRRGIVIARLKTELSNMK